MDFQSFQKIPRLDKVSTFTEKLDGTNGQIYVDLVPDVPDFDPEGHILVVKDGVKYIIKAGSRNRYITVGDDNYGFARWVSDNANKLVDLGVGRHFGEWWGNGIGRRYGLERKYFSLFNAGRWSKENIPEVEGLTVVPILYQGPLSLEAVDSTMESLRENGSVAAPGWMKPEGIVIFYEGYLFKDTFDMRKGKWADG